MGVGGGEAFIPYSFDLLNTILKRNVKNRLLCMPSSEIYVFLHIPGNKTSSCHFHAAFNKLMINL